MGYHSVAPVEFDCGREMLWATPAITQRNVLALFFFFGDIELHFRSSFDTTNVQNSRWKHSKLLVAEEVFAFWIAPLAFVPI